MTKEQLEQATKLSYDIKRIDNAINVITKDGLSCNERFGANLSSLLDEKENNEICKQTIQVLKNKRRSLQSKFNKIK